MQQLGSSSPVHLGGSWLIPRPNTKRRKVYDALVAGKKASEIMRELGMKRKTYGGHRYFITCWENANAGSYARKNR